GAVAALTTVKHVVALLVRPCTVTHNGARTSMSSLDWASFLKQWSGDVLASTVGEDAPASARAAGWLGFAPATEDQIAAVEALFFANWLPGAHRYRSFEEMMQAEYHRFSGGEWRQPEGIIGGLPDEYIGSPGSPKRRVKKRTRPRVRRVLGKPYNKWTFEEL